MIVKPVNMPSWPALRREAMEYLLNTTSKSLTLAGGVERNDTVGYYVRELVLGPRAERDMPDVEAAYSNAADEACTVLEWLERGAPCFDPHQDYYLKVIR